MSDEKEMARAWRLQWEQNELREFRKRQPESKERYETASGIPCTAYTPPRTRCRSRRSGFQASSPSPAIWAASSSSARGTSWVRPAG